jgi:hypothetical protein
LVDEVIVEIEAHVVRWRIVGEVRVPEARLDPERLWEHTCCELFVALGQGEAYEEWNVSPTGQVTRFAFSSYRARVLFDTPAIDVRVNASPRELVVEAGLPQLGTGALLSPTAVIEDAAGGLSYWAVHHPCARPDFHHRDGFVVRLP